MVASHFDFVNVVVAERDLGVTSAHDHPCRLEPRESDLAWYCDLDDGTPTGAQYDDFVVRPAELWSITRTREGLVVLSVSWWQSAPALDHQLALAVDVARRMLEKR